MTDKVMRCYWCGSATADCVPIGRGKGRPLVSICAVCFVREAAKGIKAIRVLIEHLKEAWRAEDAGG